MTTTVLDPVHSWRRAQRVAAETIDQELTPPETLLISEWAERFRYLPDTSAEPGPWRNARTPYGVGIMDACLEHGVEQIVFEKCAQIGGSEFLNNIIGYFIHQDPAPIILVQSGEKEARAYSKERIGPMIQATPVLRNRVAAMDDDTTLSKAFIAGHLAIAGANAPAGLRSRARRIAALDEVDSYPPSAGAEGDPVGLVIARTRTFWNRVIFLLSTPTLEGLSRIEAARDAADEIRIYLVPCPHCNHFQRFKFENLQWEKKEDGEHLPDTAEYLCEACGALIPERRKHWMLDKGVWRSHRQVIDEDQEEARVAEYGGTEWIQCDPHPHPKSVAFTGFTALYSPWMEWPEIVTSFLDAKDDRMRLQVWVNTVLGEVFREKGYQLDAHPLLKRVEIYPVPSPTVPVPDGVLLITAGVDVQADRLEVEIVGWGLGYENWSLDFMRISGDPSLEGGVWTQLDTILGRKFKHPAGPMLSIFATAVDSGYLSQEVYRYCSERFGANVWAVKGFSNERRPIWDRPSNRNKFKANVYPIGVDSAKVTIYAHLRVQKPEGWDGGRIPGFCHFPARAPYDVEYFRQLTSEKVLIKQNARGHLVRQWVRRPGRRAEALDCRVYAFAANWGAYVQGIRLEDLKAAIEAGGKTEPGRTVRSAGVQVG